MIYIAESGSTKCDAVFLEENGTEVSRIRTIGFNPYFHSAEFIDRELQKVKEIQKWGSKVTKAFFYGAGCSSKELNQKVVQGLSKHFPHAEIQVDHDLMASAYATYTGEPAISCILGTGSNTVYFDGKEITKGISGLGYILGDEGSASYIGKKLIASYLYETMPPKFRENFETTFKITREEIRQHVYEKPHANVFIGSFSPFAYKHLCHPFFYDLVYEGFHSFVETQVLYFEEAKNVPIHFVGSIAHHFQDVLEKVISDLNLKMGQVVRRPIDGLVQYYFTNILGENLPSSAKTTL